MTKKALSGLRNLRMLILVEHYRVRTVSRQHPRANQFRGKTGAFRLLFLSFMIDATTATLQIEKFTRSWGVKKLTTILILFVTTAATTLTQRFPFYSRLLHSNITPPSLLIDKIKIAVYCHSARN
jgi:hypothetical protein